MIALVDYGAGNLFSCKNALGFLGADFKITKEKEDLLNASGIILPGVGAFKKAMESLEESGLIDVILQCSRSKPLLGICLGMQMLFEESKEFETTKGLGILKGNVTKINGNGLKIPHMGWNDLKKEMDSPLTQGVPPNPYVYFVHSFKANALDENIIYSTEYGEKIPALVGNGMSFGAQFHPEKSAKDGLIILDNFVKLCR